MYSPLNVLAENLLVMSVSSGATVAALPSVPVPLPPTVGVLLPPPPEQAHATIAAPMIDVRRNCGRRDIKGVILPRGAAIESI